jgi:amino acid adenylation domain-containing protein
MKKNIVDYLESSAARFPDKTAYADENRSITFGELKKNAQIIASTLTKYVQIGMPVAVYMDKSVACIEAFCGTAYSGAFYVPIDIHMPEQRAALILETLQATVILTRRCDAVSEELLQKYEVLFYEDILEPQEVDTRAIEERQAKSIDTNPVYAIFTSGSTGVPKGVLVSHRSVINFTEWWCETFEFSEKEIFANQTPFYFDASVKDIYATLRCGATMYIVPKKLFSLPKQLVTFLNEKKITCIDWVPSALCMIVNFRTFEKVIPEYLQKVMFLGEVMPTKQYNMWKKYLPDVRYANLYGPTEATGDCTYYKINREFADDEPIPIGYACNNTEVFLLDENDQLVETPGAIGELCVRGCSLALGYYNNEEKTNAVFTRNPLQKNYYEKIYRTGDLARYNSYGEIVFVSRKDSQIKHMGHRIELGEIESAIMSVDSVMANCCLFDPKASRIMAFYVGEISKDDLIRELKEKLPNYMMPAAYYQLDELPVNLNGKTDRVYLTKTYIGDK